MQPCTRHAASCSAPAGIPVSSSSAASWGPVRTTHYCRDCNLLIKYMRYIHIYTYIYMFTASKLVRTVLCTCLVQSPLCRIPGDAAFLSPGPLQLGLRLARRTPLLHATCPTRNDYTKNMASNSSLLLPFAGAGGASVFSWQDSSLANRC